jgi:hypothetical protein
MNLNDTLKRQWRNSRITLRQLILMQGKMSSKKRNLLEKLTTLSKLLWLRIQLNEQVLSIYTGSHQTACKDFKVWAIITIKLKVHVLVDLWYLFIRKWRCVLDCFFCRMTLVLPDRTNDSKLPPAMSVAL